MRTSNCLFTKGSIVFVRFPAKSDKAFLNGRPLIVVSNPSHILNTLIVCTTGTQNKPGIKASFYNHIDNCYVGGAEVSNIYPYSLMTIYTDQIVASIGQLDPFILDEVSKAIEFHLGNSREVPKYLEQCASEIVGVSYNNMEEKYIRNESISNEFIPAVNYKRQYKKADNGPQLKLDSSDDSDVITSFDMVKWSSLSNMAKPNIDYNLIVKQPTALSKYIDHESVAMICSRIVPITMVAKKYNITNRNATDMRITLTNMLIEKGKQLLESNINMSVNSSGKMSDMFVLGIILAKEFSNPKIQSNILDQNGKIDFVKNKYKLNFKDKRTWKGIENFYTN